MKILVTGGSGVLGTGTITELLRRGHSVVLLSRHAKGQARQWPSGIAAIDGDVTKPESLGEAAAGCDVVLHLVGIVDEEPPDVTFERVNVQGTSNVLAAAEHANVPRFVYVSSLGAPTGASEYHASKRRAEKLVRGYRGSWTICRPGNVYGPGDDQISLLLRLVRGTTPLVPTIGTGTQRFQPIWWEDAARALAEVCERTDLDEQELDLAGGETTSQRDLIDRMSRLTGRDTQQIPIPDFLASLGAKAISLVGWDVPLSESQVQMMNEENLISSDGVNALTDILHIQPTPIDDGLRALADQQPEQLPKNGIGALRRKQFWADIEGARFSTPELLFSEFRAHFSELMPVFVDALDRADAEDSIREGESVTLALPMRGHVQVRVVEVQPRQLTLLTLQSHPLAGAVRFLAEQRGSMLRFQVEVYDRAANAIDFVALRTVGDTLQRHTWSHVVEGMIERSGGRAPEGVQHVRKTLDDAEADAIHEWLDRLATQEKCEENAKRIASA